MNANDPVEIFRTNNLAQAGIFKNMLEGEGIRCELDGENQPNVVGIVDLRGLVRAWDEGRARRVLSSHPHHYEVRP